MKLISVIFLSLLFLYSGVAWALDECLHHGSHLEQGRAHRHDGSESSAEHTASEDPSVPVIHCTSIDHSVSLAVQTSSVELVRPIENVAHPSPVLSEGLSPVFKNDLWREALFKRILTCSFANDLARYLVLSIFQI